MSDPKEIYLQPECCADQETGRLWCEDPDPADCEDGKPWVKYVRADLLEALALLGPDSPEFGMNYNDETDEWSCNYCCANDLDRGIGWNGVHASEIPHEEER